MDVIPKIIHQTWVGPRPRPDKWMQTWREMHPDWEYRLWSEDVVRSYPFKNREHIDSYLNRGVWHGVADIVRYEALHDFGGIVAPADAVCLLPHDPLLEEVAAHGCDCYTCMEGDAQHMADHGLPTCTVPLLGASQGNELAAKARDLIFEREHVLDEPWKITGNLFFGSIWGFYPRVWMFPYYYFVPEHGCGQFRYTGDGPVYSKQYWGTTRNLYEKLAAGEL